MPRRNLSLLLIFAVVSVLCYQRASRNRYAATLAEAMNVVKNEYVNEVEPRVLFEGAMDGMIGKLDPYSGYTSPEEYNQFQEQLDGEFTGIGIIVDHDAERGRLDVVEALIGKPAHTAGMRARDVIVAIDGTQTSDIALRDAVKMIRGKAGTLVKLRVLPGGREPAVEYDLQRATIPLETVLGDARQPDGKWVYRLASHPRIGYIRIFDNFGERTADEFREALSAYRQPGRQIDGLILDLRYNRGGLLDAACDVCDMLLDGGVVVTTRRRQGRLPEEHVAEPGTELPPDVPLVVLVDRLSASASEIVAAALQDHGRAVVAGQRSWGKGTVQNVIKLEGGKSALRLTIGSYHRPSGTEIHKWKDAKESDDWGVRPDPGLEVLLTNRQDELIVAARRKRDFIAWDELLAAANESQSDKSRSAASQPDDDHGQSSSIAPPVPTADPDSSDAAPEDAVAVETEAAAAARKDPAVIDPQLRKALEHLQQKTAAGSRRAARN